jgi:LacI family transcriptional regulator
MENISNEKLLQFNNLGLICIGSMFRSLMIELPSKIPYILSLGDTPRFPGELGIDHLTIDFIHSAYCAVNHLIEGGHRDIAYIGANSSTGTNLKDEQRFLGFQSAMKQGNLTIRSEWIEDGKFHLSGGYEAMKRILSGKHKPTALFAASDRMALGAYKAIQEFGLIIPNDIAVVSFDNIQMSEFISPTLTTVHVPREELGRTAVKLLIQRMQGNITLPMTTYLPTSLIIRDSCGFIKKTIEEVDRMK